MRLEEVLRRQFPQADIPQDAFLQVGSFPEWDSLAHLSFLLLVEETYGFRFGVEEMAELKSICDLRRRLAASGIQA